MNKITIQDNRFYKIGNKYLPRVTHILSYYPSGIGLSRWLGNAPSYEEAEKVKIEAGRRGTKVHKAIAKLIAKKTVYFEDFAEDEWEMLLSFVAWVKEYKPKFIKNEQLVVSKKFGYAGTLDCIAKIGEEIYLIDWKTSGAIHSQYLAQLGAYTAAQNEGKEPLNIDKLAILRLGTKHKTGYEFKVYDGAWINAFNLFMAVKQIFDHENPNLKPNNKEYPLTLKL